MSAARCLVRARRLSCPRASVAMLGAAAFAGGMGGCATPSTPFEGRPVLAAIQFEGNGSISSGELLSKIVTAPTSGVFSKTARYYDADLFALDEKRIVRWYNRKGFYEARVDDVEERPDDRGRVTLIVRIHEGPRATVREVRLEGGASTLTDDEIGDLRGALPLHRGDGFDEDVYDGSKGRLEAELKEHGFAQAKVTGRVAVAPEEAVADITYSVDAGSRYRFGRVLVSGNRSVPTDEIVRATGIDRGDPFRLSLLELAQQHVYNLGVFSGVRVGLEPFGDNPVAAVRVNVREAPFQTLRLGIGLQAEQTRYEIPRLRAEYTHRDLFGGLRRLELASNLGYAFSPTITTPKGPVTLTTAQLVTPRVLLPGLDFIVRGEFAREVQVGFSYDQVAARASLLYRRGKHAIAPGINFVRYLNASLESSLQITDLIARGGNRGGALIRNCLPSCTLTYPEIRYTFDARDNVVEPRRGFYATIDLQQTLRPGSFNYFRVEPEVRGYLPLGRTLVVAGRAYWGALFLAPGSDYLASPFTQRFFGGGQSFNRGYSVLQQGPKLGAKYNTQNYATTVVPVGGNGEFLLSGEVRIHTDAVLRHSAVVPFIDASRVTNDATFPFQAPLELAPGLGLRYFTPFGPVRLDVAYLLHSFEILAEKPDPNDPLLRATPVNTGCDESTGTCIRQSRFAFHLTLGEAF